MPTRTLGLDCIFRDERIEYSRFEAATSLLDYDVLIWDPEDALIPYFQYAGTYAGLRSLSHDRSEALISDASRRRKEIDSFLELGRTLVVFLPPPAEWYVDTGEREYSGTGRNRQTTNVVTKVGISLLLPFTMKSTAAKGSRIRVVAGDPFASFWRECKELFAYQAYLDEPFGTTLAVVEGTEHAVAAFAKVKNGRVLLLPQLLVPEPIERWWEDESFDAADSEEKKEAEEALREEEAAAESERLFVDQLFELISGLTTTTGDFAIPAWAETLLLPGESDQRAAIETGRREVAKLLEEVEKSESRIAKLRHRKLLFAGTGEPFEQLVGQAFEALGCSVEEGAPGRTDRIITRGEHVLVTELKGKGKSAVEANAAQLEKWVSDYLMEHGKKPKPVLIVNAWRGKPLDKRTEDAFPHQMLKYATDRGHCLMTGLQLLGAWLDVEEHPDRADEVFESIVACVGLYDRYADWSEFIRAEAEQSVEKESPE
jgi:hypothetical protein